LRGVRAFALGVVLGAVAVTGGLYLAGLSLLGKGLTVEVEATKITAVVQARLLSEARRKVPDMVTQLKSEIPGLVARDLSEKFTNAALYIAGVKIALPQSVLEDVNLKLQEEVRKSLVAAIDNVDTEALVLDMVDQASREVVKALRNQLLTLPLVVELPGGLEVPVKVVLTDSRDEVYEAR